MRKRGSYIANCIDREYRTRKMYEQRKQRVKCLEKDCTKCQFQQICEDRENNDT